MKFLHDAYVLAEFADRMCVDKVRLQRRSEQWPDGFVEVSKKTYNVEVTSTHDGRKLGDEYRNVSAPTLDPVENWVARAESIPKYLDECFRKKINKRYEGHCWQVVYLNIDEYDIRQHETEKVISEVKARYANAFDALWVLWKGKIY